MQVRALMTSDPVVCLPADSCAVAGQRMQQRQCGFLPVVESLATQRVVGVLTDRDLALHLVKVDRPASQVLVRACMAQPVTSISPDAELEEAAAAMEAIAVHRLPVVEAGRVIGVLSLKDIAREARRAWARTGPNVAERQLREIMEAIAAVRTAGGSHG